MKNKKFPLPRRERVRERVIVQISPLRPVSPIRERGIFRGLFMVRSGQAVKLT
jgi:hypothetical protein